MKFKLIWISLVCLISFACENTGIKKKGNEIAVKVEKYRDEKGKLPSSLSEIGIVETESGPIYYKKESETKYILWFGKELGESEVYDSETKQWK